MNSQSANHREFRKNEHLAFRGQARKGLYRIREGWACRYWLLPNGKRQIASLFLPGDYCEPQWLLAGQAEWPVMALTGIHAEELSFTEIHASPGGEVSAVLGAILNCLDRQSRWIVSLGRKSAVQRVSELLAELFDRVMVAGRGRQSPCVIPLTQQDIADIVGLTPVHVNRVLQSLRSRGLIEASGRRLILHSRDDLVEAGRLDP